MTVAGVTAPLGQSTEIQNRCSLALSGIVKTVKTDNRIYTGFLNSISGFGKNLILTSLVLALVLLLVLALVLLLVLALVLLLVLALVLLLVLALVLLLVLALVLLLLHQSGCCVAARCSDTGRWSSVVHAHWSVTVSIDHVPVL